MFGYPTPALRRHCSGPHWHRLAVLLLAVAGLLTQAEAVEAPPTFQYRNWLVDDGLPHNVVSHTVQDSAGYLWLATGAGLTRFDGRDFQVRPLPGNSASMNYNIRDLVLERDGHLLFLPASGGIMRYDRGAFTSHPASEAVANLSLVDLFAEPNGTLWLGAENETVIRWQEGKTQLFGGADGITRRGNRYTFALDEQGRAWVAGGDFLGWYDQGKLRPFTQNTGTSIIIASARSGGIWVATHQRLMKLEHGGLKTLLESGTWPPARSSVSHLFEDSSGSLWVATRRDGLFLFRDGRLTAVETASPLISSVNEDREGNIWVAMEGGGLDRVRPKPFILLDRTAGLVEDVSTSVCADDHGVIWFANRNGGLMRYEHGKAQVVAKLDETAAFFAISVCPDRRDFIWVGTTSGLFRVRAQPPFSIERMGDDFGAVRGLFCSRRGDIWMSSGDGAWGYFRDGRYHAVLPNARSSSQRVTGIAEDAQGHVWGARRDGALYEWADGALNTSRAGATDFPVDRINTIHFDHRNNLWVTTPHGILRREGQAWRAFSKHDGLPDDNVEQIIEDDAHRLWFGSRIGLFTFNPDELDQPAVGPNPSIKAMSFGRDEGLSGATPLNGVQPMTWRANDHRLWFVTHRGLIGLQPDLLARPRPAPTAYIDQIKVDGQSVAAAPSIHIPANSHRLDFHFVALNFSAPEKIRVRHRLVGLDRDWIETVSEHNATYPDVAPGQYEMRVIASNQDGTWSSQISSLVIVVQAAWWQTWWASGLLLLAFTVLVAWLVRYLSHRRLKHQLEQLERERTLEQERSRIARDLHDELGGSLTQIRLLAERIKRHAHEPEFKNFAGQLARRVRQLGSELESIIWTVSPKNNTLDRLAAFIGQYALKFFRDTTILCSVEGSDQMPPRPLRPEEQHHVLAVAKEALNNIVKHSQATSVQLAMTYREGIFSLMVQDDGIGFDPERADLMACNGLTNMRTRLREIGAEFSLESAPARGTTIMIHLPMESPGRTPTSSTERLVHP